MVMCNKPVLPLGRVQGQLRGFFSDWYIVIFNADRYLNINMLSLKPTYPTLRNGKSFSEVPKGRGYVSFLEGTSDDIFYRIYTSPS